MEKEHEYYKECVNEIKVNQKKVKMFNFLNKIRNSDKTNKKRKGG